MLDIGIVFLLVCLTMRTPLGKRSKDTRVPIISHYLPFGLKTIMPFKWI